MKKILYLFIGLALGFALGSPAAQAIEGILAQRCTSPILLNGAPVEIDASGAPVPDDIQTEIRNIMQRAYFVLPDPAAIRVGLKQIDNILKRLKGGKYAWTTD